MRHALVTIAAAVLLASVGRVQATDLEPPELERYLRWGILRVRPGISLQNLGYDDNIFYEQSNQQSDFRATISPRLDGLVLLGSRAFITLDERLDYTAYLEHTDQNFLNNRTRSRITVPFNRFGVFGDLRYNTAQWRPIDEEDQRVRQRERRIAGGLILHPGWRTEIEIGQSWSTWGFSDPDNDSISRRLDRRESGTTVLARYHAMGRSSIRVDGLHTRFNFDNPPVFDPSATKNGTQLRIIGGLEVRTGGSLSGRVQLGWEEIAAQDPRVPDFSDLVGEAELIFNLRSRTRLRLDAWRLGGFATSGLNIYYLDTHAELRAVHYLNGTFGVESGGTLGRLDFPGSLDPGPQRVDRLRRYDVGVRLRLSENRLGKRVEYSLRVGRYRRDSNRDEFDQTQNTAFFGAVLGF